MLPVAPTANLAPVDNDHSHFEEHSERNTLLPGFNTKADTSATQEHKVYRVRWLMLILFCAYSASNAIMWITFAPISSSIINHYDTTALMVNMLSMVYMMVYIPGIYPATYILERYGLRRSLILGTLINVAGGWVRFAGAGRSLFWVVLCGQVIASVSQLFVLSVPPKLAAVWFAASQRATATSVAVLANQCGIAIGFLLPPLFVDAHGVSMATGIWFMLLTEALLCTLAGVALIVLFRSGPPTPPSHSQEARTAPISLSTAAVLLFSNRSFVLLMVAFAISTGTFYAISTLLNQALGPAGYSETQAGYIGFINIAAGIFGAIAFGYLADKTRAFKTVTMIAFVGATAGFVWFAVVAVQPIATLMLAMVIVSYAITGLCVTGLMPIGLEYGCELTYPVSEETSSGWIIMLCQVFGIVFIFVAGALPNQPASMMWFLGAWMCVAVGLVSFVGTDYRRMAYEHSKSFPGTQGTLSHEKQTCA